ncbi:hypothetical protein U9M48_035975 [Paspalum notatum var. saurae]|uniref:Uncharacterized protein n=1 Tax=Paspalum notatum var. saurae TaxID=547442 RepID=A0AAQ3UCL8_PASNO
MPLLWCCPGRAASSTRASLLRRVKPRHRGVQTAPCRARHHRLRPPLPSHGPCSPAARRLDASPCLLPNSRKGRTTLPPAASPGSAAALDPHPIGILVEGLHEPGELRLAHLLLQPPPVPSSSSSLIDARAPALCRGKAPTRMPTKCSTFFHNLEQHLEPNGEPPVPL